MTTKAPPAHGPTWNWTDVRALCLREARRVLGPSSAAGDAAQEAAIRAWRQRERCQTPARPDAWLAAIARHEALRLLAERREQSLEESVPALAGDDPREPDRLAALDLRRALQAMIARTCAYWSAATGKICPTAS